MPRKTKLRNKPAYVTLRPALPKDDAFLLEVYCSTRADEMASTGWDEAQQQLFLKMQFDAQRQHYRAHYPEGEHSLILFKQKPAGRLYIARSSDEIRILDIALLPAHRNQGTGTLIIKELTDEASRTARPVRIYVESFSRALRLFERMGFSQVEQSGFHYLMQWQAARP